MIRRAAALALCFALAGAAPEPRTAQAKLSARAVQLNPEDPAQAEVGRLRYLGGIELSSPDPRFGGLSGMRFLPDGRLLAVTDQGDWVHVALDERDGRLTGARDLQIARMVDTDGSPLRSKAVADAEALEIEPDGTRLVSFERTHRVLAYAPGQPEPRALTFPDRMWLAALPANGGLEAVTRVGGARVFIAEEAGPGRYSMVVQSRGGPGVYGRVFYSGPSGYKPTDAAALDDAHILVLHRRFSPLAGVSAVLSLVPLDTARLTAGAGVPLAELVPPVSVDNMEALAVRREGGRTFVYLASDDNFSSLQRTLLMKFELTR